MHPRLQSFSLPKKKDAEPEAPIPQSPTSSSDRDDLEVTYEYPGSSKHPKPRYLQETFASINSRQRKTATLPAAYRTSSYSAPVGRTSLPASANVNPEFTKTAAATATSRGDAKGAKGGGRPNARKGTDIMNATLKVPVGRTGKTPSIVASHVTPRILFNADFPPSAGGAGSSGGGGAIPQSLGSSIRRSITEIADPSSAAAIASIASGGGRPRTAPPRLRKKEIEMSDLLNSKKIETSARMQPPNDGSQSSRLAHSSLDYMNSGSSTSAGRASARRSTVGTSSSSNPSASFSRAKTPTRAQWK
uniref:Uncharacterized protein n=1 Tax=Globisporangium ultimum (strain ATCC 200006 / CBS 805.95 / DAOM BR144) TaxID=431595 RepID=K3W6J0_GLOUD